MACHLEGAPVRLRHIEVFHAVYTTGSISRAATLLNVSQPSVSKTLRHAEDQLGFKLFERARTGLIASRKAEQLYHEVKTVYRQIEELRETATNLRKDTTGQVHLAVNPAMGLQFLPKAVAEFRTKIPGATFDVQTLHTDQLESAILHHEVEIGIAFAKSDHPNVESVKLGEAELVGIFPKSSAPSGIGRIDLACIAGRPLVSILDGGPLGEVLRGFTTDADIQIDNVVTARTYYMAKAFVEEGIGASVIDQFSALAGRPDAVSVRYLDPPMQFSVYCLHLNDKALSSGAGAFLKFLQPFFGRFVKENSSGD